MPDVDRLNYDLYASILAGRRRRRHSYEWERLSSFWDAYKIKRRRKLFFDSVGPGLSVGAGGELLGVEMAALVGLGGRIDEIGMSVFIVGLQQEVL